MERRFEVLEVALALVAALRALVERIQQSDGELATQLRRAGSAAEVRAALRVAVAWGYVEATAVAPAEQLLDRVAAMLWRLTHPQRQP